jgi:3D (Asp-Asp-Asp) domain-containing protein
MYIVNIKEMKHISTILKVATVIWLVIILIELDKLKRDIKELKRTTIGTVTVTMYHPVPKQTDSSPYITASGFRLDKKNPKKDRIIAISRDLKQKLDFGDTVILKGIGKWDGEYVVHDVMNKRFKNRIDILINPNDEATMFKEAKLMIP